MIRGVDDLARLTRDLRARAADSEHQTDLASWCICLPRPAVATSSTPRRSSAAAAPGHSSHLLSSR
jgi:hypothetical protein